MTTATSSSPQTPPEMTPERRNEQRAAVIGELWLLDCNAHAGRAPLRCRCLDASENGMRLRAPVGFGINAGRTFELCSHLPHQSPPVGLGLSISRRARVAWTRITLHETGDVLELGVDLERDRRAVIDETQHATPTL